MGENTKIEWAHHTFNPWIGCTKVAPECSNCYAETQDNFRKWTPEGWGKGRPRKLTSEANWRKPVAWNREAAASNERPRVFCASLADVFDSEVVVGWRSQLFDLIEETPHLDWLLLTKRPENLRRMLPWGFEPWRNVWLGTSVGHPDSKWRIGELVSVPAVVHFLSCEPLLADLGRVELHDIEWVICGGESGPGARPMHPRWAKKLRDQCEDAEVAFLFKQWGEWTPETTLPILPMMQKDRHGVFNEAGDWRQGEGTFSAYDNLLGQMMYRVGKKEVGRLLDGREWNEFPRPASS